MSEPTSSDNAKDGSAGMTNTTSASASGAGKKPSFSLWRDTDYGKWLVADTCGSVSSSIRSFSVPLLAQALTGSAAMATLLDSIMMVCSTALELPGGVIQDRFDRKKLMMAYGIVGTVAFGCCALVLWADGSRATYGILVGLVVIMGARAGLLGGTPRTMLRGIVPDEHLPKAMSLTYSRDSVVELAGTPIAGALMTLGNWFPMLANTVMCLCETVATNRITKYWHRDAQPQQADTATAQAGAQDSTGPGAPHRGVA